VANKIIIASMIYRFTYFDNKYNIFIDVWDYVNPWYEKVRNVLRFFVSTRWIDQKNNKPSFIHKAQCPAISSITSHSIPVVVDGIWDLTKWHDRNLGRM
jgi:hypothetical protein